MRTDNIIIALSCGRRGARVCGPIACIGGIVTFSPSRSLFVFSFCFSLLSFSAHAFLSHTIPLPVVFTGGSRWGGEATSRAVTMTVFCWIFLGYSLNIACYTYGYNNGKRARSEIVSRVRFKTIIVL
jgi:hypothetical protein